MATQRVHGASWQGEEISSVNPLFKENLVMPITRTSRLSVRASPEELVGWTHLVRSRGHATTSDWMRCLLTSAEVAGHDGRPVLPGF